jgi:hypothetical protein
MALFKGKESSAENKGRLLTKEDLLQKQVLKIEKVEFNNGDYVFVREMTGRERDTFERSIMKETRDKDGNVTYEGNIQDFRAKLCVHAVCDEKGNLLLRPENYEVLSINMSAGNLERIVNAAQKLSGISKEDRAALTGESEAGQAGDSNSDSVES